MDQTKRAKRTFSPEQKAQILHQIETDCKAGLSVSAAVEKQGIAYSMYAKWKKQFSVAVKSGLRNGKALVDKEKNQMRREIEKLQKIVLSQAQAIADLKKETNWE